MNILSPVNGVNDIYILDPFKYGTEFFFGYMPEWWIKKYNGANSELMKILSTPINNRNDIKANVLSGEEVVKMVYATAEKNTKLYLVLNAKYYPEYVYEDLKRYIREVYEMGIRYFICCDLGMIKLLEMTFPDVKVVISCLNQVTNSMAVDFYSQFKNVRKIVFPRHMSSEEIKCIAVRHPEMEFEYFIFSNKCMYDDGYCRGLHAFTPICKEQFINTYYDRILGEVMTDIDDSEYWAWTKSEEDSARNGYCTPNFACSACSLLELAKIKNITTVKMSIRGHAIEERLRQVQMARRAIQCAFNNDLQGLRKVVCSIYGKDDLCRSRNSCMMV